jgi:hypothetical protein
MAGAAGTGGAGGEPMCKLAVEYCANAEECCGDLNCAGTVSSQWTPVCCAMGAMDCFTPGVGADCCGYLYCETTDTSPQQPVCCGKTGDPCMMALGEDCCGSLNCNNNVCG